MATPLGAEIDRLRAVEARLLFALQVARAALDSALTPDPCDPGWAYCPRCQMTVRTIDDGDTCGQCKLVL